MLDQLAVEVNFVWNYVNDLCFKHLQRKQQFFSAYDIAQYTKGTSKISEQMESQVYTSPAPHTPHFLSHSSVFIHHFPTTWRPVLCPAVSLGGPTAELHLSHNFLFRCLGLH